MQHTHSFTEKPQALIDLLHSMIQTHKPTWTDYQQLLLTLFNTEELCHITLVALKWLEDHAPMGTLNAQAYAQGQFPKVDLHCNPNDDRDYQLLNGIRRPEGKREKGHEFE
jgi:hypothetical protein